MKLFKITAKNWFPIKERVPIFSDHLNKVIDNVNAITDGDTLAMATVDKSSTAGDVTIDAPTGKCAIDATATAVVVTNKFVKATSLVLVSKESLDTTLLDFKVVSADGSFTITGSAAATADVVFSFVVIN